MYTRQWESWGPSQSYAYHTGIQFGEHFVQKDSTGYRQVHGTTTPRLELFISTGRWVSWDTEKMEVIILFRDNWHCFLLKTRFRPSWGWVELKNQPFPLWKNPNHVSSFSQLVMHNRQKKGGSAERIQVFPQIWQDSTCSGRVLWNSVHWKGLTAGRVAVPRSTAWILLVVTPLLKGRPKPLIQST